MKLFKIRKNVRMKILIWYIVYMVNEMVDR